MDCWRNKVTKFQKFLTGLEILERYNNDCIISTKKQDLDEVYECNVLQELDLYDVSYLKKLGWRFEMNFNDTYTKGVYQF